ncbi:MAG: hypothetical protein ABIS07_11950 [Dokdonella sp.]
MKPSVKSLLLLAALSAQLTSTAFAQEKTDYTLNDDKVHFHVPPSWTAIMEKTDGNPEAIAFQVPDPTAQGSDDSATVTVKSRLLKTPEQFDSVVLEERLHAKEQAGYALDISNTDGAVNQYFVMRGKTKYLVRDSFHRSGAYAVAVRCQRPLLEKTPPAWNAAFDGTCAGVTASLSP